MPDTQRDTHLYHLRVRRSDERCRLCAHGRPSGLNGAMAFAVVRDDGTPVLETGNWVEALNAAQVTRWPRHGTLTVLGTHPSHKWGPPREGQSDSSPRCTKCGAWDNTSYGSQAPCGYDFRGRALVTVIEDEMCADGSGLEARA